MEQLHELLVEHSYSNREEAAFQDWFQNVEAQGRRILV